MKYNVPFYALQSALYATLNSQEDGVGWFDSGSAIEEIADFYKDQSTFSYGVIGAVSADAAPNKDLIQWQTSLDLEIYSNYTGRKAVVQQLESLLNYLEGQETLKTLNEYLKAYGFYASSFQVSNLRVNLPVFSDAGIWQSGATTIKFVIWQVPKEE